MAKWVSAKEMHNRAVMDDPNSSEAARHKAAHSVVDVQSKHQSWRDKERKARADRRSKLLSDGSKAIGKLGKGWLW
jgi:hypothetical protein